MKINLTCLTVIFITGLFSTKYTDGAVCPNKLDLVFVVDSSGSVGPSNWKILTDFLVLVVDRFTIGTDNVRVAVVRFEDVAKVMWKLDSPKTSSKLSLKHNLKSGIPYSGGSTHTADALETVTDEVFDQTSGDRDDAPNLVVVVTDGKSNGGGNLKANADLLKTKSRVISIGVTDNINQKELEQIASTKCDSYTVDDFNQMDKDMASTMDLICGCMPGQYTKNNCGCENCPVNQYQDKWAQTECTACSGSSTTFGDGATQCTDYCLPGYMINADGNGCEMCAVGTFQPSRNIANCRSCPPGYTTIQAGSTDQSSCIVLCPKGSMPSTRNPLHCDPCPVGTYKPTTYSQDCMNCSQHRTTKQTASTEVSQCIVLCDAGQYHDTTSDSCELCPVNFFKSTRSELPCTECPAGTITSGEGSTDVDDCYVPPEEFPYTENNNSSSIIIAAVVISVILLLLISAAIIIFMCRKKRNQAQAPGQFKKPAVHQEHVCHNSSEKGANAYINQSPVYHYATTQFDDDGTNHSSNAANQYDYATTHFDDDDTYHSSDAARVEKTNVENPIYGSQDSLYIVSP